MTSVKLQGKLTGGIMDKEFILRSITFKSETKWNMSVTRTRTTEGFAEIDIQFAGSHIKFNNKEHEEEYEQMAVDLAGLIKTACNNPCLIGEAHDQ